jgi:hypothetical protein
MPEIRRKYDAEFREGAVTIVRETGRSMPRWPGSSASVPARWGAG